MHRTKVIPIVIVAIFFGTVVRAQDSEGLIQKAYKRFILKEKSAEKKPVLTPEKTDTAKETAKGITGKNNSSTAIVAGYYDKMSKAELIQEIKGEIDSEGIILDEMPEFKKQKDKDGNDAYSYLVEGKQINLEDADENILRSLAGQVGNKAARIKSDALLEQMEQVRAAQDVGVRSRPPQVPQRPPTVPQRPPEVQTRPPAPPRR